MNILRKALILVVPVMFLAGCATAPTDTTDEGLGTDSSVESGTGFDDTSGSGFDDTSGISDSSVETMGLDGGSDISSQAFSLIDPDPANLLNKRVIYFDFDRSKVKAEFTDIVAAHATYLANNPGAQMKLEGHADERGSREYNIGLGERRGNSVARHLGLQGAARGQLDVVSFGEERPAAMGHDESSWSLNRRVEIVYTKQK